MVPWKENLFYLFGNKEHLGVLSSKMKVIRSRKGAISLVLTNKISFSYLQFYCLYKNKKGHKSSSSMYLAHGMVTKPK